MKNIIIIISALFLSINAFSQDEITLKLNGIPVKQLLGGTDGQIICKVNGKARWVDKDSLSQIVETLTVLDYDANSNELSYTDENGNTVIIPLNTSIITPLVLDGHIIATHEADNGLVTSIQETITTLEDDGFGNLIYTSENGSTEVIDNRRLISVEQEVLPSLNGECYRLQTTYTYSDGTTQEFIIIQL